MTESEPLTCYLHPDRETLLRCNRCDRPICISCAVRTPTGYACKECIRGQQKKFDNAKTFDLVLAPIVAAIIAYGGSYLISFLSFFTLLIAPLVGMFIAESTQRLTQKRRSALLVQLIFAGSIAGSIPLLMMRLVALAIGFQAGSIGLGLVMGAIWQAAYAVMMVGAVRYRLMGIRV
jgi:hypothetical protein